MEDGSEGLDQIFEVSSVVGNWNLVFVLIFVIFENYQKDDWGESVEDLDVRGDIRSDSGVGEGSEHLSGSLGVTDVGEPLTGGGLDKLEEGWKVVLGHLTPTESPELFACDRESSVPSGVLTASVVS